jgi:DNA-binding response OmpR family regulator
VPATPNAFLSDAASERTILVVEDDRTAVRLVRFCLERAGFAVRHAADGEEALREFDRPQPADLVLLDVMLPYHSGFDLLANLRARPAWEAVPVIMLSSSGREEHVVKSLSKGANDYLSKPFRPAEVVARIRNLIETAERVKQ